MEKIYIWIIALMVLSALVTIIKPRIKGKMGEATVSMLLKKLDKNKYQVVNDVLLSAEGGNTRTTQIDHVVVSIYGIFSIETKNYKGQIYGSESSAKWTQNIYGHKYSFMNPIYQNYAHVKALNALLQSHGYENIPVFSIVTFPGDAVLKIKTTKSQVVKWGAVTKTVKKLSVQSVLSREDMDKILAILKNYMSTRTDARKHVNEINEAKYVKKQKEKSGMCPKCAGALVLRNGKYGKFYGCSNYPKCRYTAPVK